VISSLLTLLGLASIVAGVVLTAFVRAKKLGEERDTRGCGRSSAGSVSSWPGSCCRSPPLLRRAGPLSARSPTGRSTA